MATEQVKVARCAMESLEDRRLLTGVGVEFPPPAAAPALVAAAKSAGVNLVGEYAGTITPKGWTSGVPARLVIKGQTGQAVTGTISAPGVGFYDFTVTGTLKSNGTFAIEVHESGVRGTITGKVTSGGGLAGDFIAKTLWFDQTGTFDLRRTDGQPSQQGKPDLCIVETEYQPGGYARGSKLTLSHTVKNTGTADTAAAPVLEVRLSQDKRWGNKDDLVLLRRQLDGDLLTRSQRLAGQDDLRIPDNAAGKYYLAAVIDADRAVVESKENNNVWWSKSPDITVKTARVQSYRLWGKVELALGTGPAAASSTLQIDESSVTIAQGLTGESRYLWLEPVWNKPSGPHRQIVKFQGTLDKYYEAAPDTVLSVTVYVKYRYKAGKNWRTGSTGVTKQVKTANGATVNLGKLQFVGN